MSSKDSGRSTRISLACIACRSRKHRCSGERPRCAQCISNNVTCEWPAQQKRGPPKQYIHSLETRLFETEAVLLALMPQVSARQLQASFQQISSEQKRNELQYRAEHDSEGLTVIRPDICKPSYWSSFPIDSPENVKRWWEDRMSNTNSRALASPDGKLAMGESSDADQHTGVLSMPEIVNSDDPGPSQFNNLIEDAYEKDIMSTELQGSMDEVEYGAETSSPNGQHFGDRNMPFQRKRARETEDTALVSNEDDQGVLKLPGQFKLDFIW